MRKRCALIIGYALCVSLLLSGALRAAGDGIPPEAYARVNAALLDNHILPRYERLAAAASGLAGASKSFCEDGGDAALADVRARYHEAMDAWMAVQHLSFGPVELFMRSYRLYFWPEARGRVGSAVNELLATRDPAALAAARLADASVAVQGLPAVEHLLYIDDSLEREGAAASDHCALLVGISSNMRSIAGGIAADWRGGGVDFRRVFLNPGPDNDYYQAPRDATLALFKSFHGGLQVIADVKLEPVVGESRDTARPALVESRASERALRNIIVNLEALRGLYLGEGGPGLSALVREFGTDPDLDPLMRKAFRMTLGTAKAIDGTLADAATREDTRPDVEKLSTRVLALKQIVKSRVAPALDLAVGFNARDGD